MAKETATSDTGITTATESGDSTAEVALAATPATINTAQRGGLMGDSRPGTKAQGVEFGSPYDPDTPPWSVYTDPLRAPLQAQEREESKARELRDEASGTEYVFKGHKDKSNHTQGIQTVYGMIWVGQKIKLSDVEVEALRESGFKFDEAKDE